MADIELVEGVGNYRYIISIWDPSVVDAYDNPTALSFAALGIKQAFLTIETTDFLTKLINAKSLVLVNDSQVGWDISPSDIPAGKAGDYFGQVDLQDNGGNSVLPQYPYLTVKINKKL